MRTTVAMQPSALQLWRAQVTLKDQIQIAEWDQSETRVTCAHHVTERATRRVPRNLVRFGLVTPHFLT